MLKAYKKIIFSSLVFVSLCGGIILTPFSAQAASIVPCSRNTDDSTTTEVETDPCTVCHLFLMAQRVVGFITKLMAFAAVAVITAAGIIYIVSSGNSTLTGMAKSMFTSVLTGFILILSAFVIINTIFWLSVRTVDDTGAVTADENSFLQSVGIAAGTTWSEFTCDTTPNILAEDRKTQPPGPTPPGPTPPGGGGTPKLGGTIGFKDAEISVKEGTKSTIIIERASGTETASVQVSIENGQGGVIDVAIHQWTDSDGSPRSNVFDLTSVNLPSNAEAKLVLENVSANATLGTNREIVIHLRNVSYKYEYKEYTFDIDSSDHRISKDTCNSRVFLFKSDGRGYAECQPEEGFWRADYYTVLSGERLSSGFDTNSTCKADIISKMPQNYPKSKFKYDGSSCAEDNRSI